MKARKQDEALNMFYSVTETRISLIPFKEQSMLVQFIRITKKLEVVHRVQR